VVDWSRHRGLAETEETFEPESVEPESVEPESVEPEELSSDEVEPEPEVGEQDLPELLD
jgi:hypothetical protein